MGSAMAWPLRENGHEVNLVGTHLDGDTIDSCMKTRFHPRLKRKLPDGVRVFPFSRLDEAFPGSDVVLSGVNSMGVHWMADVLSKRIRAGQTVIGITKGLETTQEGEVLTFPEVLEKSFPEELQGKVLSAAIGGPCIAGELAGKRQTGVVFGCKDFTVAQKLAAIFRTSYYHVWPTKELLSLETGVALKNAYTLGVGLAYGLLEKEGGVDEAGASMHNLASAFFAQGTSEIHDMIELLGGRPEFAYLLPGAGDLYVTSMGGRTVKLGRLLGMGKTYEEAREIMKGETLESVEIVRAVSRLLPAWEKKGRIDGKAFPMMRMLVALVQGEKDLRVPIDDFFRNKYAKE